MVCPYCHDQAQTKVVDKRDLSDDPVSRRRRECLECGKRFTTYERIESIDLTVIKKDGSKEDYDREKLKKGINISTNHRLDEEDVEEIIEDIEFRIFNRKSTEVSTSDIGRMVLTRLKRRDRISYMRFASVFLDFEDLEEFKKEIEKLES